MKHALLLGLALCGSPWLLAATSPNGSLDRFLGSWNCVSVAGSTGQFVFTRTADGLALRADWKNGGRQFATDHRFALNRDGGWTTTETNAAKTSTFTGNSTGFDGDTITFTGTARIGDRSFPQLEKFRFMSADAFAHIWYGQSIGGQWQPNGYQECTKIST